MPTYEYECLACRHHFELFQSILSKPAGICPKCGKKRVRRLIGGGSGIIFKGTGFYQTDYRSAHYRKRSAEEKGDKASGKSATTGKPEAAAKDRKA